jgi:hypothetical protein
MTQYKCRCGYSVTIQQWRSMIGEKCPDCQKVEVREFRLAGDHVSKPAKS